jgi:DNA-binding beta-propeller fold protein YncE
MKVRSLKLAGKVAACSLVVAAGMWLSGCGSTSANVVSVSITPPGTVTLLAGQQQAFTGTVSGSTVLTMAWTCTFTTTTVDPTTGKSTTSAATPCTSQQGTISVSTDTTVVTFTAPALSNFPTVLPAITLTATADADKKKTGTVGINLDSGIRVAMTPTTVNIPVGVTPAVTERFIVTLLNAAATDIQYRLVQPNTASTNTNDTTANPLADPCSPTCGAIDSTGVFTAPATYPTATTPAGSVSTAVNVVYVVAWSLRDPNHIAVSQITLVNVTTTNAVTFDSIFPTQVAAGGVAADIFLNAKNLLNTTTINFIDPFGNVTNLTSSANQVFTIPISLAYCTSSTTVTCDASIVTRVRLNAAQLAVPGKASIQITGIPDPNNAGQTITITKELDLVYASPALVAAVPDSFPLGLDTSILANGGYYGGGNRPIVQFQFNGNPSITASGTVGNSRQVSGPLSGSQIQNPGLYPISVNSTAPLGAAPPFNPPPFPTVTTNVAVQPNFSDIPATFVPPAVPMPGGANSLPSSIVINPVRNYALITEQGTGVLRVADLSSGTPVFTNSVLLPCGPVGAPVSCNPTGVTYTDNLALVAGQDTAVVVNSTDQSLALVAVPSATFISKIDLSGLLTAVPGGTIPAPFAVGVDSSTNLAIVAYSNSNVGFIVDLRTYDGSSPSNTQPTPCFKTGQTSPCVIASVSLTTGPAPQVIMQPNVPLAYVTPGGSGNTTVVNLLSKDNSSTIAAGPVGAVRTNNVVTIVTTNPHGINPATGGTVLISGITTTGATSGQSDMNGTYLVNPGSVTDPFTFSYSQAAPQGQTLANETGGGGSVQYGSSYYAFNTTPTAVGGAINPVTRTFAFADPNSQSSQINFIQTLDQSVLTATLLVNACKTCPTTNPTAPETGFRFVAFDPYINVAITFNPKDPHDEISFVNPGGATSGATVTPYRISPAIGTGQVGTGTYTPAGATAQVSVFGGLAYNPNTKLVLAANAGSGTLTYFNLNPSGNFLVPQISGLTVTAGGVANAQPPLATSTTTPPKAVCDPTNPKGAYSTCLPQAVTMGQSATARVFGKGFSSGAVVARLDGDPTGVTVTGVVSDAELDIAIDASRLGVPHDFALGVTAGGVPSNTTDLFVIGVQDLTSACATAPPQPQGVAIDEQRSIAIVTNYGCNNIAIVNLDTTGAVYPGKAYGATLSTLAVGNGPMGVAVIPRLGYAVTANNLAGPPGTASIIDISNPLSPKLAVADVSVGISPMGVAIDQDHAFALLANNGSNTISVIDLTVLFAPTVSTPVAATVAAGGAPSAISVDPNRAVAVVTNLQNSGTTAASAGLDVINLSVWPPTRNSSTSLSNLSALASGIAYDPAPATAVFYVTSSQSNIIYTFNPDTGLTTSTSVGINPFTIAYNYQTGTMFTINAGTTPPVDGTVLTQNAGSSSVVDTQTSKTRATLAISSQSQFAAAMQNLTNTAVVADQNNNRLLLIPMPK